MILGLMSTNDATSTDPPPPTSAGDVLKSKLSVADVFKKTSQIPVTRLLGLARSQWRPLAIGTFFLLIGGAAGLAWPQAIKRMMDGAFGGGGVEAIDDAALILLILFAIQGVAIGLRAYLFTVAGERIVTDLRRQLFSRLLNQEVGFFDVTRTGELLSRLAADTGTLQNTVSVNVSMALRNVVQAAGALVLLIYTSPILTALMLLVVPPVAVGAVVYGRRIRRLSGQVQDALAAASHVAEESISGIRTVRSFAAEASETERYSSKIEESFRIAKLRAGLSGLFVGVASIGGYVAVAVVLWYGGRVVLRGEMSVGDLTSFVIYTMTVAFSLGALGGLWADFMRAVGAGDRVFSLLDRVAAIDNDGGQRLDVLRGRVELRDVHFRYPGRPDVPVLKGIDLVIEPGEVVALVGPSGGGKTTISALLPRLYDPDQGAVLIDGVDVRELDGSWLRTRLGVVAQEPTLFSTTVAENIRYGRVDASEDDIIAAAEAANAHDFVSAFPEGYQTQVGERGIQLSGGQKQRVAIARAVLRDPALLILDEATSALDAESEHLVQAALERLMKGRTTLVIAHRLSTVRDADRVVVIDGGAIVDSGPHETLMQHDGLYRKLVERQLVSG